MRLTHFCTALHIFQAWCKLCFLWYLDATLEFLGFSDLTYKCLFSDFQIRLCFWLKDTFTKTKDVYLCAQKRGEALCVETFFDFVSNFFSFRRNFWCFYEPEIRQSRELNNVKLAIEEILGLCFARLLDALDYVVGWYCLKHSTDSGEFIRHKYYIKKSFISRSSYQISDSLPTFD